MKRHDLRRVGLLLLGGFVLAVLAVPDLARQVFADTATVGLAQQSYPATPTWTPTWTPYFYATPFPSGVGFTPTPTLDLRVVNEITHPADQDVVAGFTPLIGTAVIDNFARYDLHISVAGAENWQWLYSSREVVRSGLLYLFNAYAWPDGLYDLRLRALDYSGHFSESFLRQLAVRNAAPPTQTPYPTPSDPNQPFSPLILFPTPSPTATPTPRFRSFLPNGQGIYAPQNGEILRGQVAVVATANNKSAINPFERYELFLTPSGSDQWSWLYSSSQQFWQSPIYTLDSTQLADGFYDLRLRIVYRDSNYDEYYVTRLRVDNAAALSAPAAPAAEALHLPGLYFPFDRIRVTGVVDLVGTTAVPGLLRWELYWAYAGSESWNFLFSDVKPVVNSYLARLDLGLMAEDSYDFRLKIVRQDGTSSDYYVRSVVAVPPTPTAIPQPPR